MQSCQLLKLIAKSMANLTVEPKAGEELQGTRSAAGLSGELELEEAKQLELEENEPEENGGVTGSDPPLPSPVAVKPGLADSKRAADLSGDNPCAKSLKSDLGAERPPPPAGFTYFVFLTANKGHKVCRGEEDASIFRSDWGDFVSKETVFGTQGKVDTYISTLAPPSPPSTPVKMVTDVDRPAPSRPQPPATAGTRKGRSPQSL